MAEKEDCAGNESSPSSLRKQGPIRRSGCWPDAVVDGWSLNNEGLVVMGPCFRRDDIGGGARLTPHNSLAFENANELTRRVFSSKISVRVIGGSARWLQFSRSQSRQLTPMGVPSAFSRSMPVA